MKTIKNIFILLILVCIGKIVEAQNNAAKPSIKLTVQTVDVLTKQPVKNVRITVLRNDSSMVEALNDEKGALTLLSTDSNFIDQNHSYKIMLNYPNPVSCNTDVFAKEFTHEFKIGSVNKNEEFVLVYKSKNISPEVLNFDVYTMYFDENKNNMNQRGKIAVDNLTKLLKQYPNFEITLMYNETGLNNSNETKFFRLEYLTDLLTKKGVHIKRITTSIKYIGGDTELKEDVCNVGLTGFNYGRQ